MRTLQIRNVPEDVHVELRSRAARLGLSLSDYLLDEVTRVAERPAIADVLADHGRRKWGVARESIVATVRQVRDDA